MKKIRVPVTKGNLVTAAKDIRQTSRQLVAKFTNAKLQEAGLISSSFSTPILLSVSLSRRELNLCTTKLKNAFLRGLEKRVGYLKHSRLPFLQKTDAASFTISVVSDPVALPKQHVTLNSVSSVYTGSYLPAEDSVVFQRFFKTLDKYMRMLNVQCRKTGVPLMIGRTSSSSSDFSTVNFTSASRKFVRPIIEDADTTSAEKQNSLLTEPIEVMAVVEIPVNLVYLHPLIETSLDLPMDQWLENRFAEIGYGLYNDNNWVYNSLGRIRPTYLDNPNSSESVFGNPEVLFFYLPQILKVMQTLTRINSYVPAAFSISTRESA